MAWHRQNLPISTSAKDLDQLIGAKIDWDSDAYYLGASVLKDNR
jgi:hypothetical protein